MPTYSAMALDRLLEPGAARSKSTSDPTHVKITKEVTVISERRNGAKNGSTTTKVAQKKHHWTHISPVLYTTPEATPVPDTPSSYPASPYLINYKCRGASLAKKLPKENSTAALQVQTSPVGGVNVQTEVTSADEDVLVPVGDAESVFTRNVNESLFGLTEDAEFSSDFLAENDSHRSEMLSPSRDSNSENFFDPRDSLSYISFSDGEDSPSLESSHKVASSGGEFYNAAEDLSSESGTSWPSQPPPRDFEADLSEMKLALFTEVEKRELAEDSVRHIRCQWQKVRKQLSSVGITLPADPPLYSEAEDSGNDTVTDLCQQINVARFVSEAVGRGLAKAEAEKEMEAQLKLKNFEISRLIDRLHYYETVNQEMSHRNQEVLETARRQRKQRDRRRTWVWGSVATAITLGTTALAWSYHPSNKGSFFSNYTESSKDNDKPAS